VLRRSHSEKLSTAFLLFVIYDKFINYVEVVGSLGCGSEPDEIAVSAAYIPEGSRKVSTF
jgi:hypothetical protein